MRPATLWVVAGLARVLFRQSCVYRNTATPHCRSVRFVVLRTVLVLARNEHLPATLNSILRAMMLGIVRGCLLAALQGYLFVQEISDGAIEVRCIRALKHHLQIVAF